MVPPFLSDNRRSFVAALLGVALFGLAQLPAAAQEPSAERYVVDIELQTTDEFSAILTRAEQLLVQGVAPQDGGAAVTFVLHGPVIRDLLRSNYLEHKDMVDLAASLSALRVVSIKACRAWMASNNVEAAELQPFIETVSYGPGEVRRLVKEENYIYF